MGLGSLERGEADQSQMDAQSKSKALAKVSEGPIWKTSLSSWAELIRDQHASVTGETRLQESTGSGRNQIHCRLASHLNPITCMLTYSNDQDDLWGFI